MKQYSFLLEFDPFTTTLAGIGAVMGAYGTYNSIRQNSVDNKYLMMMSNELFRCKTRQQALAILDKYMRIGDTYNQNGKKNKRLYATQYKVLVNYCTPIRKILLDPRIKDWHNRMMDIVNPTTRRLKSQGTRNTALGAVATGISATSLAAPAVLNTVYGAYALTGYALYNQIKKQLKFVKSTYYITSMTKELKVCKDPNQALQIVEKYSYNIANDIQNNLNKAGNKIPVDVQDKVRNQFYLPIANIIKNGGNYWHQEVMNYIQENNLQSVMQHICDSILYLLLPKILGRRR